jgi:hypothetical protein
MKTVGLLENLSKVSLIVVPLFDPPYAFSGLALVKINQYDSDPRSRALIDVQERLRYK